MEPLIWLIFQHGLNQLFPLFFNYLQTSPSFWQNFLTSRIIHRQWLERTEGQPYQVNCPTNDIIKAGYLVCRNHLHLYS